MEDKATKRGGGAVVAVALVAMLLVLPITYVLSVGPLAWMDNTGCIDQSWMPAIETAYWSLGWSAEHVPLFGSVLDSYGEWLAPPKTSRLCGTASGICATQDSANTSAGRSIRTLAAYPSRP